MYLAQMIINKRLFSCLRKEQKVFRAIGRMFVNLIVIPPELHFAYITLEKIRVTIKKMSPNSC